MLGIFNDLIKIYLDSKLFYLKIATVFDVLTYKYMYTVNKLQKILCIQRGYTINIYVYTKKGKELCPLKFMEFFRFIIMRIKKGKGLTNNRRCVLLPLSDFSRLHLSEFIHRLKINSPFTVGQIIKFFQLSL